MQIDSFAAAFRATHAAADTREVSERFEIRRSVRAPAPQPQATEPQDASTIDSKTLLIAWLFEYLTGKEARFSAPGAGVASPAPTPGTAIAVSYSRREVHRESETTTFRAEGDVTLKSGARISFSLELTLNRELTEIDGVAFAAGGATDPIAVNLDGLGVRLSGEKTKFDLDGDGVDELVARLASGSAWLVHDTNANGRLDNGRELFGPRTGNGFEELAQLDSDGNGWIDEGDAAFRHLGIQEGDEFRTLREAGIGALALGSVATPFAFKQGSEQLGALRSSSIYLTESGSAGFLQQVDLTV